MRKGTEVVQSTAQEVVHETEGEVKCKEETETARRKSGGPRVEPRPVLEHLRLHKLCGI